MSEKQQMPNRLSVCLDARLVSGNFGGIEQVIIGLAHGLSQLDDGEEEYLFLTYNDADEWIRPHMEGPCRILKGPSKPPEIARDRQTGKLRSILRWAWHQFSPAFGRWSVRIPKSSGLIECAGIDVMHFTIQNAFLTDVPSIFLPHDLQHLHLPQFFSPRECLVREIRYRSFCNQADIVSVMTEWGKQDLIQNYDISPDKVAVIPWAPVLDAYIKPNPDDLATVQREFSLPEHFIFYPAMTWPHKNHINLLEALAILKNRWSLNIPLVCSGKMNSFFPEIEMHIQYLGLADHVKFLGYVSSLELQCLYKLSCVLVFPSLFEGFGMPVLEAFLADLPVACSNVTSLPEVAGEAALFFDPTDPEEIAEVIRRLWMNADLRQSLATLGRNRVNFFSWDRTARVFRAYYRQIAGYPLSEDDRILLSMSPYHQ
jgi:glycosyltransferase involved in cell wall biosynthesis